MVIQMQIFAMIPMLLHGYLAQLDLNKWVMEYNLMVVERQLSNVRQNACKIHNVWHSHIIQMSMDVGLRNHGMLA